MKNIRALVLFLAVLSAAVILALGQPGQVQAADEEQYYYYVINGEAIIYGVEDEISGDVTIPATLGGYPVRAIGECAFYECDGLTGVTVPEGVTEIVYFAFEGCGNLTTVILPDSLESIGSNAFYGCESLNYNTYGNARYLGNEKNPYLAFMEPASDSVTEVTIHKDTKVICDNVLFYWEGLNKIHVDKDNSFFSSDDRGVLFNKDKTVLLQAPSGLSGGYTLPDSVQTVKWRAFANCGELAYNVYDNANYLGTAKNPYRWLIEAVDESVTSCQIHKDAKIICENAFYCCSELGEAVIPEGVTTIADSAFMECSSLKAITIPGSVKTVGDYAFGWCWQLTDVTIENGVTAIGEGAFYWDECLRSITIPASVTTIGTDAFYGCYDLTGIHVDQNNTKYSSDRGVLFDKNKTLLIQAPSMISGSYAVPDTVTVIGSNAFSECDGLTGITLPEGLKTIGDSAFYYCTGLTSVVIPGSVKTIGNDAFLDCIALTSVTLGNGVSVIGTYAFAWCEALTEITIPESVQTIGNSAFWECGSLASVKLPQNITEIGWETFGWCKSLTSVVIPEGVTAIDEFAFYHCEGLTSLTIPSNVRYIGPYAFSGCEGLQAVVIPASVAQLEGGAFRECTGLKTVHFLGNAPAMTEDSWSGETVVFVDFKGTVYYPAGNSTWTENARRRVADGATWAECKNYEVSEGADSVITGEVLPISLRTAANAADLVYVCIDGKIVAPENYVLEDDTRITFRVDYLASLKTGCHSVAMVFCDGCAETTLTVEKNLAGDLDGVGDVNEDDAIYLLQYVLMPDLFPVEQNVDYDGSGAVNEDDAIYLLQHVLMPDMFPL